MGDWKEKGRRLLEVAPGVGGSGRMRNLGDIKEQLEPLLARHAVLCAVFAQKNGEDVLRFGDFERLEHGDLPRLLFGGQRELVALHASLEGRILPQTYRQGSVECVVSRTDAFVYGLFIERSVDMKASYMAKKKLREAVDAVLARNTVQSGEKS
jgi:hypothetical protein